MHIEVHLIVKSKDEVLKEMRQEIGKDSEPGAWFVVDQQLIDRYIAISGETSWMHTDSERVRKETKYSNTIAPGNLGIALMPRLSRANSAYRRYPRRYSLNQGWDRIRYLSALPAGSRIRSCSKLISVQEKPDGSLRVEVEFRMEVENQEKPWVTATKIGRFFY